MCVAGLLLIAFVGFRTVPSGIVGLELAVGSWAYFMLAVSSCFFF